MTFLSGTVSLVMRLICENKNLHFVWCLKLFCYRCITSPGCFQENESLSHRIYWLAHVIFDYARFRCEVCKKIMSKKILVLCTFLCTVFTGTLNGHSLSAQCQSYNGSLLNTNYIDVRLGDSPDLHLSRKDTRQSSNRRGIVSGSLLLTIGGLTSLAGHLAGEYTHNLYSGSAFTKNSDSLRRKVYVCKIVRAGGAVVGATGLVVLVLSF
jgi:hypothetical protein